MPQQNNVEGCHQGACSAKCSDELPFLCVLTKCCLMWYINLSPSISGVILLFRSAGETPFSYKKTQAACLLFLTIPAGAPVSDSLPPSSQLWWALYFPRLILISHFHCRLVTLGETEVGKGKPLRAGLFFSGAFILERKQPGVVMHIFNPSTVEAEEDRSLSLRPARVTQGQTVSKNEERD